MKDIHTQKTDLGSGSVGRLLFRLALPAITAQIINLLYNMVDRIYIGHIEGIGADALTGIGVAIPLIMCVSAFSALVSMGGAPRASILMGRGDSETAEKVLGNCAAALTVMAVILTIILQCFGRPILLAFGASENTIVYAWDYMKIYSLGTVFVQLSLGLNAFINAQGYAKMGMMTILIGAVCNIILDPIFIFGFNMGVKGAALATILSQGISAVWVCHFLISGKSFLRIRKENLKIQPSIYLPCVALGASPFVMQFTESVLFVCFNTSLLKYGGDLAVGAMTILTSAMQFSLIPLTGLTQGAQPITSYNYGAGNMERVGQSFRLLLISCIVYSGVTWLLCMRAPQVFVGLFTSDPELIRYACWAIRIYMAVSVLIGAQIACQQTFIALGNAKVSLFLALLRKVFLLIPMIYILPNFFENKVLAVFLAEPVSDALAVLTTVTMFFFVFRKLKREMGKRELSQSNCDS